MQESVLLTPAEVERLLSGKAISDRDPWVTGDERCVDDYLRSVCSAVTASTGSVSKVEWDHYGSGYASYVDAWFYKDAAAFDVRNPTRYGHEHTGLVVLMSRLSPYVVFMEGEQHWHAHGGSSYLPAFDAVDQLKTPAVAELAQQVQPVLERYGLVRIAKERLGAPLSSELRVPTILTDGSFRQFDALFHWED
jgi:hypothetical protein